MVGLTIAAAQLTHIPSPQARSAIAVLNQSEHLALALGQPPYTFPLDWVPPSDWQPLDWAIAWIPAFLITHESPHQLLKLLPPALQSHLTPTVGAIAGLFSLALHAPPSPDDRWQILQDWIKIAPANSDRTQDNLTRDDRTQDDSPQKRDRWTEWFHQCQTWQQQGFFWSAIQASLPQPPSFATQAPAASTSDQSALASSGVDRSKLDSLDPALLQFLYSQTNLLSYPGVSGFEDRSHQTQSPQLAILTIALRGAYGGITGFPLRSRLTWQKPGKDRTMDLAQRLWATWIGLHPTAIDPAPPLPLITSPRALNLPH
ncbi:MAG: hypothetical protein VKJ24_11740 [Synechococcales bacterium]|nr:hypothetical protein [Synechococcales bacterium]